MVFFRNRRRLKTLKEQVRWRASERPVSPEILWVDVTGRSMVPFLKEGDRVGVELNHMPDIGDIFYFHRASEGYLHRCLDIRLTEEATREYFEKGDAYYGGNWIPEASVVGTVRYVERDLEIRELRTSRMREYAVAHQRLMKLAQLMGLMKTQPARWRYFIPGLYRRYLAWKGKRLFSRMPRRNREILLS